MRKGIRALVMGAILSVCLLPLSAMAYEVGSESLRYMADRGYFFGYIPEAEGDVTFSEDVIAEYDITELAVCFEDNTSVTSVVVPEGIELIGDRTFSNATSLEYVELPSTVKHIDFRAFYGCSGLKEITLPDGVVEIHTGAFEGCTALERIVIPETVKKIYGRAFYGCTSLREVIYEGEPPEIGAQAFYGCSALENNDTGAITEEKMAQNSYREDASLRELVIPEGITVIPDEAFWGCVNLERVEFPASLEVIGRNAFRGCTSLSEIVFSTGLKIIYPEAFFGAEKLTEMEYPEGITAIGVNVLGNTPVTKVTLPTTLEEIIDNGSVKIGIYSSIPVEDFSDNDGTAKRLSLSGFYPSKVEEIENNFIPRHAEQIESLRKRRETWVPFYNLSREIHPEIVEKAKEIVGDETDPYQQARLIEKWIDKNIKYEYKSGDQGALAVLRRGTAICGGYSVLTRDMLGALGIPCNYIDGESSMGDHAWNEAYVNGRWINIDSTWDDFDFGDARFTLDHIEYQRSMKEEDIPSSWAREEMFTALMENMVPSNLDTNYRKNISRSDFCEIIVRVIEKATGMGIEDYVASQDLELANPFSDILNDRSVLCCYALGIVNGMTEKTPQGEKNRFRPMDSITREQAAVMLARLGKVLGLKTGKAESFADQDKISGWAKEGVNYVSGLTDPTTGEKVMGGTGGGFTPQGNYTREQALLTGLRIFHSVEG